MTIRPDIGFILWYPLNAAIKGEDVDWALIPVDLTAGRDLADRLTYLRNAKGTDAFGSPIVAPVTSPTVEHDTGGDDGLPAASPSVEPERRKYRDLAIATATQVDDVTYLNDHPDEGDAIDAATVAELGEHYKALEPTAKSWVTVTGAAIRLSGVTGEPTERRKVLLEALLILATPDPVVGTDFADDDIVRGICHRYLGEVAHFANVTPAQLVGALGIDEARKFANAARALVAGNASVRWDEQRRCYVEPSRAA